jgi:regulator of protease activity HflC (stomatin/prohibitin superfamily)
MAMAANLAGIVHRAVIVRREIVNQVVRVATIAVLVVVAKVEVVKEGDRKDATKAGRVAAADGLLKGSRKSN